MAARETTPPASAETALPGARFCDAFALLVPHPLDMEEALRRTLGRSPAWVRGLMAARNLIVAPFALKTGAEDLREPRAGFFPLLSKTEDRAVLGMDDRHLDFRIVFDLERAGDATTLTATTLVRPHNAWGRAYLAGVLPFHRMIVPAMLNQALDAQR